MVEHIETKIKDLYPLITVPEELYTGLQVDDEEAFRGALDVLTEDESFRSSSERLASALKTKICAIMGADDFDISADMLRSVIVHSLEKNHVSGSFPRYISDAMIISAIQAFTVAIMTGNRTCCDMESYTFLQLMDIVVHDAMSAIQNFIPTSSDDEYSKGLATAGSHFLLGDVKTGLLNMLKKFSSFHFFQQMGEDVRTTLHLSRCFDTFWLDVDEKLPVPYAVARSKLPIMVLISPYARMDMSSLKERMYWSCNSGPFLVDPHRPLKPIDDYSDDEMYRLFLERAGDGRVQLRFFGMEE